MPDFPATDPLFLSTLSLRRATPRPSPSCHPVWDFYPRSPCGERPGTIGAAAGTAAISIHALLTESDAKLTQKFEIISKFLSTLSLRRATKRVALCYNRPNDFYPRSPYGERLYTMTTIICTASFLSTLSLRRATNAVRIA